jgi:DNA-binding transcriptional ArsR family regulator
VRPRSWLPDFLTPPPISSLAALDDELAVVLATPPEQIRVDVTAAAASAPLSPVLRELLEEPERTLPQLVDGIRDWWRVAIEPDWPRMQALLEADIGYRTRQLAIGGVEQLFDNLHPTLSWAGDRLVSNDPLATALDLNGRGLPLTPSIFATHGVLLTTTSAAPPIAIYPARAVGTLWEQQQTCPGALKRLLGRSRAQLLTYTSSPSTTTQLAARTGLSLGAVSQHLSVLRDAGLVTSHRYRREVNYTATDLGVALLDRA